MPDRHPVRRFPRELVRLRSAPTARGRLVLRCRLPLLSNRALAQQVVQRARANTALGIAICGSVLIHVALFSRVCCIDFWGKGVPQGVLTRVSVTLTRPRAEPPLERPVASAPSRQRRSASASPPPAVLSRSATTDSLAPRETAEPAPQADVPRIDLERARALARASAVGSEKTRDARFEPPSQERESEGALAKGIAKALRPDCREAYSGAGLFAVPFLLRDTLSDRGCKW